MAETHAVMLGLVGPNVSFLEECCDIEPVLVPPHLDTRLEAWRDRGIDIHKVLQEFISHSILLGTRNGCLPFLAKRKLYIL